MVYNYRRVKLVQDFSRDKKKRCTLFNQKTKKSKKQKKTTKHHRRCRSTPKINSSKFTSPRTFSFAKMVPRKPNSPNQIKRKYSLASKKSVLSTRKFSDQSSQEMHGRSASQNYKIKQKLIQEQSSFEGSGTIDFEKMPNRKELFPGSVSGHLSYDPNFKAIEKRQDKFSFYIKKATKGEWKNNPFQPKESDFTGEIVDPIYTKYKKQKSNSQSKKDNQGCKFQQNSWQRSF